MVENAAQRHLAAILAADVVGYSRLMGQDEAGTLIAIRNLRAELIDPKISQHKGRVFKTTGDGVLVEFPSVVNAVACAVDIQRDVAARNAGSAKPRVIQLRMGINLGDVIIEGEDVFGDGVNVAARLEGIAPPGGIAVSGMVRDNIGNRLALEFKGMGTYHLKNIAKPVTVYGISVDGVAVGAGNRFIGLKRWIWPLSAAAAIFIVVTGLLIWNSMIREYSRPPVAPPREFILADAQSIVVMPFANMTGDSGLEYFADGVTETLIAGLSRSPGIRVVARTSSEAYKNKAIDVRQIGRDLEAHYLLEGSVQKGGSKVRIVAQLIDTTTGNHVWAERYDRESDDVLALQDEVTDKIIVTVSGLEGLVNKAQYEKVWGKDKATLEEYDYYLRAHQLFYRFTKDDTLEAVSTVSEGLNKFPESSLLHIALAWDYYQLVYGGWSTDISGDYSRAFEIGRQGLAKKDVPPLASMTGHFLMAYLQAEYKKDWDAALRERELTLALAPNDPVVVVSMSEIAIRAGRPDDAIASLKRDLMWDRNYQFGSPGMRLGWAYFVKGDYKTALAQLQLNQNSDPVWDLPILAATYVQLGMMTDAQALVKKINAANSSVSLALLGQVFSYRDPSVQNRFIEALRKAGLPEQ